MNYQGASLFRYQEFMQEIAPLVVDVDKGNIEPLRERTIDAIRLFEQTWKKNIDEYVDWSKGRVVQTVRYESPLADHDMDWLPDVHEVEAIQTPQPYQIGSWFVLLLAKYLTHAPSAGGNWGVVARILGRTGWHESETRFLFEGYPSFTLFKPTLNHVSEKIRPNTLPYYHHLTINHGTVGWLPTQEIAKLHEHLLSSRVAYERFPIMEFPNINVDNPTVIREYERYKKDGYASTVKMLESALEAQQGLLTSVTVY